MSQEDGSPSIGRGRNNVSKSAYPGMKETWLSMHAESDGGVTSDEDCQLYQICQCRLSRQKDQHPLFNKSVNCLIGAPSQALQHAADTIYVTRA